MYATVIVFRHVEVFDAPVWCEDPLRPAVPRSSHAKQIHSLPRAWRRFDRSKHARGVGAQSKFQVAATVSTRMKPAHYRRRERQDFVGRIEALTLLIERYRALIMNPVAPDSSSVPNAEGGESVSPGVGARTGHGIEGPSA